MTTDELTRYVQEAQWFANLGHFREREGMIAIRTMEAWRSQERIADEYHESIADGMQWLPSDSSAEDAIHGSSLKSLAKEKGTEGELLKQSLAAYKRTLTSLRSVPPNPLLIIGPHDFNLSARNACAYATRMAACEIVTERQGFWCSLVKVFAEGNYPCGIMPDGKVVVF